MNRKTIKFTPQLTELVKSGKKYTTFRIFDEKNLAKGDRIVLATRDGENVSEFGEGVITSVDIKTISTISKEDYIGHEKVEDNLLDHYKVYYGNTINNDTEVKVIRFRVTRIYS